MKDFTRKIKLLHSFVLKLSHCGTAEEVYSNTIDAAGKILGFSVASVLEIHGDEFIIAETTEMHLKGKSVMALKDGICGRTLKTRKSQVVSNLDADPDAKPTSSTYKSCISVVIGDSAIFQALSSEPGFFKSEDLELAELLAAHAAEALSRLTTETALLQSSEKYRALIQCQAEGLGSTDKNDIFLFSNPAGEKLFGVGEGGLTGRAVNEFIDEENSAVVRLQNIERENGITSTYELEIIRPDGEKRQLEVTSSPRFDPDGKYDGSFGIFRDVTRRKQMEISLRKSEARFRELFENLVDGAYQTTADGKILAANRALVKMLGYTSEKELCTTVNANDLYIRSEDRAKSTMKPGIDGELRNVELTLRRKDGEVITVLDNCRAIMDENGKLYYEGTLTDISDRKQAQEELEKAYENLENIIQIRTAELAETVEDLKNQINDRIKAEEKVKRYAMRLEAMHKIDMAFNEADSPSDVASAVLSHLGDLIPNQRSGVMLFDFGKDIYRFLTLISDKESAVLAGKPLPLKEIGQIDNLKKLKPVVVNNIENLNTLSSSDKDLLNKGYRSYMMIPLHSGSNLFGSLNVCSEKTGFFIEEYIAIAGELANQVSTFIEKTNLRELLRRSEERYSLAVQGTNDGIWDWDIAAENLYLSPRWNDMLGLCEGEIKKMDEWFSRVHPGEMELFVSEVMLSLKGTSRECSYQYRILHSGGNYIWCQCKALIIRDAEGKAVRMVGSQSDITEQKKAEEQLLHDAFHDDLTGLANRALFLDHLKQAMKRISGISERKMFAVFFLDIDRFNIINDSFSHTAGNDLLKKIGERISGIVKSGDTVARLGGDEFAVLMEDLSDLRAIRKAAERILKQISLPFMVGETEVFITASLGISISGNEDDNPETFLRNADIAMYRAKKLRNRYEVFDDRMHANIVFRLQREREIRRAIENDEFTLYYQPILELDTLRTCGFEALIRWEHPDGKLILPNEFLPIAEEAGLLPAIGRFILKKVCSHISRWEQMSPGACIPYLNTNVSNSQFLEKGFAEYLNELISLSGINPLNLKLEITESAIIEDPVAVKKILSDVKSQNVKVHLDDFGTGYSSMSYLIDYPFDGLKIDKSFIAGITQTKRNLEVVKAILSLGHSLNLDVISEGIENQEQADILSSLGCKYTQGYFHYHPMPFAEAEVLMLKELGTTVH